MKNLLTLALVLASFACIAQKKVKFDSLLQVSSDNQKIFSGIEEDRKRLTEQYKELETFERAMRIAIVKQERDSADFKSYNASTGTILLSDTRRKKK